MAHSRSAGWALGAAALALSAFATFGFSTGRVELNLGPGDTSFLRGFELNADVEDKVAWRWTTYDVAVDLPFETGGASVDATLRYARVFGEEAVIAVSIGGVPTESFRARGGEIRSTTLRAAGVRGPVVIGIRSDSHEHRNMGLKLDRLKVEVASGSRFKLQWSAGVRSVLTPILLFAGVLTLSASPLAAGGASLIWALAFTARASDDLFAAWRQTQLAPGVIVLSTLVLLLARKGLTRKAGMEPGAAAVLSTAALVTIVARLALVSHPDFYYPDLLTHTRVVEAIRKAGPSFFLNPAEALNAQGAWTKPVLGSVSSLPYAVMFHTPFAVLAWMFSLTIDQSETALKAVSCLVSALPVLLAGALAVRLSLPPLAALLLCVIPTYTSRLSFALLPSLWGHVFDLAALLAIAALLDRREGSSIRPLARVIAALLLGHLAYTSSVMNEGLFTLALAAWLLASGRTARSTALQVTLAEAVAALGAFVLYYRHFVGDVLGLAGRFLGVGGAATGAPTSVYPVESFWALLFERMNSFFGWPWLGLAVCGLWLGGWVPARSVLVRAWVTTFLVLILLRARIPDVFRYGHETLFLTPLVALLAGTALILAWRNGGTWRVASGALGAALIVASAWQQWLSIADQLGNAL